MLNKTDQIMPFLYFSANRLEIEKKKPAMRGKLTEA